MSSAYNSKVLRFPLPLLSRILASVEEEEEDVDVLADWCRSLGVQVEQGALAFSKAAFRTDVTVSLPIKCIEK